MKIKLTLAEATGLILNHLNLSPSIPEPAVEIELPATAQYGGNFVEGLLRVTRIEFVGTSNSSNKIAAIKRLRELTACGLAAAKYAVENPDASIEHYLRTGEIASQW